MVGGSGESSCPIIAMHGDLEKGALAARRQDAPVGGEPGSPPPVPAAEPWSGTLPWHCWLKYPPRHEHTTPIPTRRPDDPRQHALEWRAVARGVMLARQMSMKRLSRDYGPLLIQITIEPIIAK
jgi:hypothetical protein